MQMHLYSHRILLILQKHVLFIYFFFVSVHQIISKYYPKRFIPFFYIFRFVVFCFERIKCPIKSVFVRFFYEKHTNTDIHRQKCITKVTFHNKNMHQRHHHELLVVWSRTKKETTTTTGKISSNLLLRNFH